ncbi:O-linked N-acetylglucosamine transferase, SPINDLY family protein [Geminocystis herdmanii]|uniref:O-linked N-acetylglucosamine transferase, SPINDLY family protein n=1 Tax=Geminocystis herdmanii TaxID=669359 RepID=UPI00034BF70D|nr:hypothetical protein [Geminocystis herdmanii]
MADKINILKKDFINSILKEEFDQVINIFEQTINDDSTNVYSYYYLGIAYLLNGDRDLAEATWMAVFLESNDVEENSRILINIFKEIGLLLIENQKFYLATLIYEQILILDENNLESSLIIVDLYLHLGKENLAEDTLIKVIDNEFVNTLIYLKYSQLLLKQYRYSEVINLLTTALNKFPNEQSLYFNLMLGFRGYGQAKEAIIIAEEGLKLNPNNLIFQIENARIFPILYDNEEEIEFYYQRFDQCLDHIINNLSLKTEAEKQEALNAISLSTNFYLQYQGKSTLTLQVKYGQLVNNIINANYPHLNYLSGKSQGKNLKINKKIKVGYISSKMFDNVIGELFYNWIKYHNQELFEVNCYYIGHKVDQITKIYQENSDKFSHIQSNFELVCKTIIEDQLDILIFLDLGMSPELTKIAGLRLAPIQCKGWGPPVTSGSPMIDYFLTSDLMENPQGEKHYNEKLIRLPNLAFSYPRPKLPNIIKSRKMFNLPEDAVIYWSCQSLFKYLPQYDYIFPRIASQVTNSKFIFIEFPLSQFVNNQFLKRLKKAFEKYNLNIEDYCIFMQGLCQEDFLNLILISNVGLDTFGWSGGKTTLEAIACNLPLVTYPSELMRGRHSYGILQMLGVTDTIASSPQEYIDIAVRLGNDQLWREEIKEKIKVNHHNLYDDLECVKGLEKFYQDVCS